ncbi:MAG: putative bifunctional diguanylate cyclase/phosphodiesterase [Dongiaceae bacterium]
MGISHQGSLSLGSIYTALGWPVPPGQANLENAPTPAIFAAAGDVVYAWSLDSDSLAWLHHGVQKSANPLIEDLTAIAYGEEFHRLIMAEDISHRLDSLAQHLARRQPHFECEYRICLPNGQQIWLQDRGAAEFIGDRPVRLFGTLRLITERKNWETRLKHLAHYDALTGQFNAVQVLEALDHALAYAERHRHSGMYLQVGIDNLSLINQALGHKAADEVIVTVAHRIQQRLHLTDIMGRMGGDRLGIVLNQRPAEQACLLAESILETINRDMIPTSKGEVGVTVSIGGVEFPAHALTAHETIARGESMLQEAKRLGRNCFVVYQPERQGKNITRDHFVIAQEIRHALRQNRLQLAFQPIVEAGSGTVAFSECLARIQNHQGNLMPAGQFMPIAEQLGLMREIDLAVLQQVLDNLRQHPELRLAVNVSGFNVGDGVWLQRLKKELQNNLSLAERITVEITETAALADLKEAAHFVGALRELGCAVALDDFGAGYTSYRQLRVLPINLVKIDGSFSQGICTNVGNQLFVRTLVELATGLGIKTIAECVEEHEDAEILQRLGVNYLQGHYFGRPQNHPLVPLKRREF